MEFRTRKIVMPAHLNGAGNLFGGQALAWIDEEAAVYAACRVIEESGMGMSGQPLSMDEFIMCIEKNLENM